MNIIDGKIYAESKDTLDWPMLLLQLSADL